MKVATLRRSRSRLRSVFVINASNMDLQKILLVLYHMSKLKNVQLLL